MPFADYKTALVTGASSGIGAAIVERFARENIEVHAIARSSDALAALAARTGCIAHTIDVTDRQAIAELAGNAYYTTFFARLLDEGRRILRLYYRTFDDRLPRQYVDEHEEMIAAIEARDVERSDKLAIKHADQIVRQIQDYLARDLGHPIDLAAG